MQDYDLSRPLAGTTGLRSGLTAYGDAHFSLFLRKAFIKALGYSEDALARPVVGIANTHSGFNPCHANAPQLVEAVKRGVHLAGGLAIEFPTTSLHESFAAPTSMLWRNLMAMDTEQGVGAQPIDACIAIGGCDKTVPAQLMGALSANKPFFPLVSGPMLPGSFRGTRLGACTDCRGNWAAYRAGTMDMEDIAALNEELCPTAGTCGVMGTASTMACLTAALGLMDPAGASAPAVSAARLRIAEETGRRAVQAAGRADLCPQAVLSTASFRNALTVLQAIGGSTNAAVHVLAIANRHPEVAGTVTLDTLDAVGRTTPLLVDLKPSGEGYMSDFDAAGGMRALLHALRPLLDLTARTAWGGTLGEALDAAPFRPFDASALVVRPLARPLRPAASLVVLRGNLAPRGAVLKASAAGNRALLHHAGPAVVFSGADDLAARIDDPDLDVTPDSVLVLQGIGPVGYPGMPEAGLIPIPRKLARQGVKDMLRVSDGRMSGTAAGTVVLHVAPEAAAARSVFAVVRDGDTISLDVDRRSINLDVDPAEIRRRLDGLERQPARLAAAERRRRARGYEGLYVRCVNQADEGADFDFLTAAGPSQHDEAHGP